MKKKKLKLLLPAITDEVLARKVKVDNGGTSSMLDFLFTNLLEEGIDHIALGDAKEVTAMGIGEVMYIGNSEIRRIK